MACSNFTLAKVYRQFQFKEKRERLFPEVEHVALGDWLKRSLEIAARAVMLTEKAKSDRAGVPEDRVAHPRERPPGLSSKSVTPIYSRSIRAIT